MESSRVTVRQLESMIRLSESMARLHCSDKVLPKHVKEAYRLLNKSIIRVDQPEVHFDDGEEDEQEDNQEENEDEQMETDQQEEGKKTLKLSYEDYTKMANLLVHFLRRKEMEAEENGGEGMTRKSHVVNWYMDDIKDELESQEEAVEKKAIVEKVIDRLAYQDNVLIPLNRTGLKGDGEESEDPILVVHPNYVSDV